MAEKISVSIPEKRQDLLDWVDEKVEEGRFSSRSHAIRYALKKLKKDNREDVEV